MLRESRFGVVPETVFSFRGKDLRDREASPVAVCNPRDLVSVICPLFVIPAQ